MAILSIKSSKALCLVLLASQRLTSCLATKNKKNNQRLGTPKIAQEQQPQQEFHADTSRLLNILKDRDLQDTYECNAEISSFPQFAIGQVFANILSQADPQLAGLYGSLFNDKTNFGVRVVKMCASCQDVRPMFISNNDEDDEAPTCSAEEAFEKYCGEDVYANDIAHSGLVFYPLEDVMNEAGNGTLPMIKSGTSPGFFGTHPSRVSAYAVPSAQVSSGIDYIFGFLATMANGFVSILPDYMGYGSSAAAMRNYLVRDAYVTASLPLWIKTSDYIVQERGSDAALADAAFYAGYSEGGYVSMVLADALTSFDVKPLTVMPGGGPNRQKGLYLLRSVVAAFDAGSPPGDEFAYVLALVGSTYSSANPNLRMVLDGQNVLASELMDPSKPETNIVAWLNEASDREQLSDRMIANNLTTPDALWDATLLSVIREANANNVANICDKDNVQIGVIDNLCTVFDRNDLIDAMENANYPINFYHSPIDEVVPFGMIPDAETNPFLTFQQSPSIAHVDFGRYFMGQQVPLFMANYNASLYEIEDQHGDTFEEEEQQQQQQQPSLKSKKAKKCKVGKGSKGGSKKAGKKGKKSKGWK